MADTVNPALAGGQGKTIETGDMTIRGHLLHLPDIIIQISNISGITASEIKMSNPGGLVILLGVLLGIIGGFLMKASEQVSYYSSSYYDEKQFSNGGLILMIGIVVICCGFYLWSKGNSSKKYLNIYLNGGMRYSVSFKKEEFMMQVFDVFSNIFESGGTASEEYYINIENCQLDSVVNNGTIRN